MLSSLQRAYLSVVNIKPIVAVELAVKVLHFTLYLARVLAEANAVGGVAHCRAIVDQVVLS